MRSAGWFAALLALVLPYASAGAAAVDPTPRTIVMSAFGPEWSALKAEMKDPHTETYADVTYIVGQLRGHDVVLFRSGVSLVNAAMSTQAALDHFTVKRIVFSGIAGGINPALSAGDVVVPAQWSEYLESVFARKTKDGYAPPNWMVKTLPNYGMIFPYPIEIAHPGQEQPERRFWIEADPHLLEIARSVAAKTTLKRCAQDGKCLPREPKIQIGGNGVTGPSFVDNADFRKWVFRTFKANVVDNESASVGHVAYANHVPFIVFRSLSDLAGGDSGENTESTFEYLASDNSAALVLSFLGALQD